ncbi:MAG TPA: hypothetical protein VG900_05065 [Hyphomicrobiaceae bacterium]|jgi:hypothetical protein|nr:hypothetical protein [Hyphomicrobiaceae bacterium]
MKLLRHRFVHLACLAALGATVGLGGCSDGVELNGKVFDWLGVSPAALEASRKEPKMAARAPLVLPPDTNRLPAPGSGQAPSDFAGFDDPDKRKIAEAQERKRLHEAYCRGDITWKQDVFKSEEIKSNRSPYGPCSSLTGSLTDQIKQEK